MQALPPIPAVLSFIDCINRNDVAGLAELMAESHELRVFDEEPRRGKDANIEAWRGYCEAFPKYLIYPHRFCERDGSVAVLGHTTGSHLDLPDVEEMKLTLIWTAAVAQGRLLTWQLIEDTAENRRRFGLNGEPSQSSTV